MSRLIDMKGLTYGKWLVLKYAGSLSKIACPLIAADLKISVKEAWESRHQNRKFWFEWCNNYREGDPLRLINESIKIADMAVGIRDREEIVAANTVLDLIIWVDRDVPKDPTVMFDRSYCDVVIDNSGTMSELSERLRRFSHFANILTSQ